jgi:hypothetical protein
MACTADAETNKFLNGTLTIPDETLNVSVTCILSTP